MQTFPLPLKVKILLPNTFMSKCPFILVNISAHGIFYVPIHNILESYIYSPDYLNSYAHDYEQVTIVNQCVLIRLHTDMLQTWQLSSASGDTITLTFQSLHLEYNAYYCGGGCCDYVEVTHSSSTQRLCGSALPSPISSSGNMEVTFRSDSFTAWTGFLAVACCDLTVTTTGQLLVVLVVV